jgi:hypothetical protein
VTKDPSSQEDWKGGSTSMTEGASSQEDWSAVVVEETDSLPIWETEVHSDDYGWDNSLAKRECWLLYLHKVFP